MQNSTEMCSCPWVDLTKPDYVAYHDTEWGEARRGQVSTSDNS